MAQQQEETKDILLGGLRDAGLLNNAARILNELAPLQGADHFDVVLDIGELVIHSVVQGHDD